MWGASVVCNRRSRQRDRRVRNPTPVPCPGYNRPLMPEQLIQIMEAFPPATLIAGIALLLLGGHWLVDGSVRIARRIGISTLLIGLTVVAFGTSSPELAFNITAAVNGNGELSFGNVVGSNIANIALVLGVAALISPLIVHGRVVTRELPVLILASAGMVFLAWLVPTRIASGDGEQAGFTRIDGLIMLLGFALCSWLWYRMARKDRSDPLAREAAEELAGEASGSLTIAIVLFVVGLAGLVAGGKLAEIGASGMAHWLGLSDALIGLTVVAVATSLPELTTSVIACRKGHNDLAVGNVVGSNLFNILLVLGATCLFGDVPVPSPWGWWDLGMMLFLTLILLPMALTSRHRITKPEGGFLLVCYFGYITFGVLREYLHGAM